MTVFEGGELVARSNFYFQKYMVLNGKKDIKYELRFQTSGKNKLISLSLKLFVEDADIRKNMKKDEANKYSTIARGLKSELS